MAEPISGSAFARYCGVSKQSVSLARQQGRLVSTPDGKLDPDEPTNAAYAALRRAPADTGENGQIAALRAKIELARHAVAHLRELHVERSACLQQWTAGARKLQATMSSLADRWAAPLAEELAEQEEIVRGAIGAFVVLLLEEIASFEVAAENAARQL